MTSASTSEIVTVITFVRTLYDRCRDVGGFYHEISGEVRGLHTVLRHLKYEIEAPESPLNRDRKIWSRQLVPIITKCDYTLQQLDQLIKRHGQLSSGDRSPTSSRGLPEKPQFTSSEMDQLGAIRVKLISHKTSLSELLDEIQLGESRGTSKPFETDEGQLEVILDKVDNIAARIGQRPRSSSVAHHDDDNELWKRFRKELIAEGFSGEVLQQNKV